MKVMTKEDLLHMQVCLNLVMRNPEVSDRVKEGLMKASDLVIELQERASE